MAFGNPLILVVFFGIFHLIGGMAVGKGIREWYEDSQAGVQLILWGAIMGIPPAFFDWFFLIREGELIYGVVSPALFVVATVLSYAFLNGELSRRNEKSIVAVLMGGTALMLGLMLTPYLIQQTRIRDDLGIEDYLCGGLIPFFFIGIGASFVWNGLSAILKHMSFDELIAERQKEVGVEPEEDEGE